MSLYKPFSNTIKQPSISSSSRKVAPPLPCQPTPKTLACQSPATRTSQARASSPASRRPTTPPPPTMRWWSRRAASPTSLPRHMTIRWSRRAASPANTTMRVSCRRVDTTTWAMRRVSRMSSRTARTFPTAIMESSASLNPPQQRRTASRLKPWQPISEIGNLVVFNKK